MDDNLEFTIVLFIFALLLASIAFSLVSISASLRRLADKKSGSGETPDGVEPLH